MKKNLVSPTRNIKQRRSEALLEGYSDKTDETAVPSPRWTYVWKNHQQVFQRLQDGRPVFPENDKFDAKFTGPDIIYTTKPRPRIMSSAKSEKRKAAADENSDGAKSKKRGKEPTVLNQHLTWMGPGAFFDVVFENAVKKCSQDIVLTYKCIMFGFYIFTWVFYELLVTKAPGAETNDLYQDALDENLMFPANGKKACAKLVKLMAMAFDNLEDLQAEEEEYTVNKAMQDLKHLTSHYAAKLNQKPQPWAGHVAFRGLVNRKNPRNDKLIPLFTLDSKEHSTYTQIEKTDANFLMVKQFFNGFLPEPEVKVDSSNIVTLDNDVRIGLSKQDAFMELLSKEFPSNFAKKFKRLEGEMNGKLNYLHGQQIYQIQLLQAIAAKLGITSNDDLPNVSDHAPTTLPVYDSQKAEKEIDELDYNSSDCEEAENSQVFWGSWEQKVKALEAKLSSNSGAGSAAMAMDDDGAASPPGK